MRGGPISLPFYVADELIYSVRSKPTSSRIGDDRLGPRDEDSSIAYREGLLKMAEEEEKNFAKITKKQTEHLNLIGYLEERIKECEEEMERGESETREKFAKEKEGSIELYKPDPKIGDGDNKF
jgi:hypothetical protein